jgi:uncharacterized membrane protein
MKLADLTGHSRKQPTVVDAVLLLVQVIFGIACVVLGLTAFAKHGGATTAQAFADLGLLAAFVVLWVVRSALLSRRPERAPR